MNTFVNKAKIKLYVNATYYTKKALNKLKEKDGLAGEYVMILIVGIVIVLAIAGILMKYFEKEIAKWLEQTTGKVDGFFDMI